MGKTKSVIEQVTDRPGHDRRYAIDGAKSTATGWQPKHAFDQALDETVSWYTDNKDWWKRLK